MKQVTRISKSLQTRQHGYSAVHLSTESIQEVDNSKLSTSFKFNTEKRQSKINEKLSRSKKFVQNSQTDFDRSNIFSKIIADDFREKSRPSSNLLKHKKKSNNQRMGDSLLVNALKKYPDFYDLIQQGGLQKDTLNQMGMSFDTISRLYRAFYVYSNGFNDMVRQSIQELPDPVKDKLRVSIWKVYLQLIESFSKDDYEIILKQQEVKYEKMIGEYKQIVNNSDLFISQLQSEIVSQEDVRKNEIKAKELKITLENKIKQLEEKYKESEGLYLKEFHLRLNIESKINQIYDNYGELKCKHDLIVSDMIKKNEEIFRQNLNIENYQLQIQELKTEIMLKEDQIDKISKDTDILKTEQKHNQQLIRELKLRIKQNHQEVTTDLIEQEEKKYLKSMLELSKVDSKVSIQNFDSVIKNLKTQIENEQSQNRKLSKQLEAARNQLIDINQKKQDFEGQKIALQQQKDHIQDLRNQLNEWQNNSMNYKGQAEKEKNELTSQIQLLQLQTEIQNKQLEGLKGSQRFQVQLNQQAIDDYLFVKQKLESQETLIDNLNTKIKNMNETIMSYNFHQENQVKSFVMQKMSLEATIKDRIQDIEYLQQKVQDTEIQIKQRDDLIEKLNFQQHHEIQLKQQEISDLQDQIGIKKTFFEAAILQEVWDNMYYSLLQFLSKQDKEFRTLQHLVEGVFNYQPDESQLRYSFLQNVKTLMKKILDQNDLIKNLQEYAQSKNTLCENLQKENSHLTQQLHQINVEYNAIELEIDNKTQNFKQIREDLEIQNFSLKNQLQTYELKTKILEEDKSQLQKFQSEMKLLAEIYKKQVNNAQLEMKILKNGTPNELLSKKDKPSNLSLTSPNGLSNVKIEFEKNEEESENQYSFQQALKELVALKLQEIDLIQSRTPTRKNSQSKDRSPNQLTSNPFLNHQFEQNDAPQTDGKNLIYEDTILRQSQSVDQFVSEQTNNQQNQIIKHKEEQILPNYENFNEKLSIISSTSQEKSKQVSQQQSNSQSQQPSKRQQSNRQISVISSVSSPFMEPLMSVIPVDMQQLKKSPQEARSNRFKKAVREISIVTHSTSKNAQKHISRIDETIENSTIDKDMYNHSPSHQIKSHSMKKSVQRKEFQNLYQNASNYYADKKK